MSTCILLAGSVLINMELLCFTDMWSDILQICSCSLLDQVVCASLVATVFYCIQA